MRARAIVGSLILIGLLLPGIGCSQQIVSEESKVAMLIPIPNARVPATGVLSGGQPSAAQIDDAARAGFRTVINLRTSGESGFEWEAAAVERAGMRYLQIPIEGAEGLTRESVDRIDAALREASEDGAVLLHCGSGNRIGAVLALREAWLNGVEPEAAFEQGLAWGMTRLAPATRERLGLPVAPPVATP